MEKYNSYKDSGFAWMGQIPSHWETRRFRFLLAENSTQNTELKERKQLQFKYGDIVPKANQSEDKDVLDTIKKYTVVAPGDIMINGLNLNYDFISQRVARVREPGVITSAYVSLRPLEGANSKYYTYYMKAMDAQKMFHGMGSGVRLTLSYDNLKNLFFPYPSPEEQDAMVAYLDAATAKIDEAIAQQQRMIDLLNERKQVIIDRVALGGLDSSVELQDSGNDWLGLIPKHWRINKFRYLFKTRTGITFTKAQLEDEGEPVISYGQIHSKDNWGASVNPELIRHIPSELTKGKEGALAMPGDFLFADTSEDFEGCGNNVFIDSEPLYAGYHTILAKKNNQEYGPYLAYLFTSTRWRGQVRSMVNGVKVYSITQGILNSANVILPPKGEQKEIADYITKRVMKLDEGVRRHKEYIKVLQERKQIIINDVVTGKVKVV